MLTASGIFVREERPLGLLTYSPFTGLFYGVHKNISNATKQWLEKHVTAPPSDTLKWTLGTGWASRRDRAQHVVPHLLPDPSAWHTLPAPSRPLVINWFLTGRCPLACKYCYAEDLMRDESREPDEARIGKIANVILRLRPLATVLTGGDPLFSPHLERAVRLLHGKTGIIVDTSGFTMRAEHVRLFKEYNVNVRISCDSEDPILNEQQRPIYEIYPKLRAQGVSTAEAALRAVALCDRARIPVTIQTVATSRTVHDLPAFGDKLYRLGIRSWRIFKVSPSLARMKEYTKLAGTVGSDGAPLPGKRGEGPYPYIFEKILHLSQTRWKRQMAVQVTFNEAVNSVVLVSPDGVFYTESNTQLGKAIIDPVRPNEPRLIALTRTVNMAGHLCRYLNLTSAGRES